MISRLFFVAKLAFPFALGAFIRWRKSSAAICFEAGDAHTILRFKALMLFADVLGVSTHDNQVLSPLRVVHRLHHFDLIKGYMYLGLLTPLEVSLLNHRSLFLN